MSKVLGVLLYALVGSWTPSSATEFMFVEEDPKFLKLVKNQTSSGGQDHFTDKKALKFVESSSDFNHDDEEQNVLHLQDNDFVEEKPMRKGCGLCLAGTEKVLIGLYCTGSALFLLPVFADEVFDFLDIPAVECNWCFSGAEVAVLLFTALPDLMKRAPQTASDWRGLKKLGQRFRNNGEFNPHFNDDAYVEVSKGKYVFFNYVLPFVGSLPRSALYFRLFWVAETGGLAYTLYRDMTVAFVLATFQDMFPQAQQVSSEMMHRLALRQSLTPEFYRHQNSVSQKLTILQNKLEALAPEEWHDDLQRPNTDAEEFDEFGVLSNWEKLIEEIDQGATGSAMLVMSVLTTQSMTAWWGPFGYIGIPIGAFAGYSGKNCSKFLLKSVGKGVMSISSLWRNGKRGAVVGSLNLLALLRSLWESMTMPAAIQKEDPEVAFWQNLVIPWFAQLQKWGVDMEEYQEHLAWYGQIKTPEELRLKHETLESLGRLERDVRAYRIQPRVLEEWARKPQSDFEDEILGRVMPDESE